MKDEECSLEIVRKIVQKIKKKGNLPGDVLAAGLAAGMRLWPLDEAIGIREAPARPPPLLAPTSRPPRAATGS